MAPALAPGVALPRTPESGDADARLTSVVLQSEN